MDQWIDQLSESLGDPRLSPAETGLVLKLAREVAHGLERKLAPLSAFVAGVYVGREVALGTAREEALRDAVQAATKLLPEAPQDQRGSGPMADDRRAQDGRTGSDPGGPDGGTG
jgi:Domain of unknown function (DUF6457)